MRKKSPRPEATITKTVNRHTLIAELYRDGRYRFVCTLPGYQRHDGVRDARAVIAEFTKQAKETA